MRHHFHRCPNLRVVTASASELHGRRRGGSVALEELCEAKSLTPCLGLVECDILSPAQKRTLLVSRATQIREEEGGPSELAGWPRERTDLLDELRRELLGERQRLVADNRRIEAELRELGEVGHAEPADESDRGDAANSIRLDDALERLAVRRLDAIDRALDAMTRGSYGRCSGCDASIEIERLRLLPDTTWCVKCARRSEAIAT